MAYADPDVHTVETDDLPRNTVDAAHYDGVSMRVLGSRFATSPIDEGDIGAGPDAPAVVHTDGFYASGNRLTYPHTSYVGEGTSYVGPTFLFTG